MKVHVKAVACGYNHSLAITPNGLLFAWGFNFCGQLGIGSSSDADKPQQVDVLLPYDIKNVSAGQFHSAAVTKCGRLFTWGNGNNG